MSYFPFTTVGKALAAASSQSNARQSGLGITAAADSLLDDTTTDAILATLGGGSAGIDVFKDATAADIRSDIGASAGLVAEAKNASFTAADGKLYEIDASGGAVAVTMPSVSAGMRIGFKLAVGGNNVTINRNGTEDIDNQASYVLSVTGQEIELVPNAGATEWLIV